MPPPALLAGDDLVDQVEAGEVVRVGAGGVDDEQFALEGGGPEFGPRGFFVEAFGEVRFEVFLGRVAAGDAVGEARLVERIDPGRGQGQRHPGADALGRLLAGVGVAAAFQLVGLEEGDDGVDRFFVRGAAAPASAAAPTAPPPITRRTSPAPPSVAGAPYFLPARGTLTLPRP